MPQQYFNIDFQAFPRLEKKLRRLRFKIKDFIKDSMQECSSVLIEHVQDELEAGDYVFKKTFGGTPNLSDSFSVKTKNLGAIIRAEFSSSSNYADFFEKGRKRNKFPDGVAYERENIKRWLMLKHGVDEEDAEGISYAMIATLREEDDAFRFPDPVIVPALQKATPDYESCVASKLINKVNTEVGGR